MAKLAPGARVDDVGLVEVLGGTSARRCGFVEQVMLEDGAHPRARRHRQQAVLRPTLPVSQEAELAA